jgi:FkbM family methyltransferase
MIAGSIAKSLRTAKRLMLASVGRDVLISPQVHCRTVFIGSEYGGWNVSVDLLGPDSVVYSFGVGEDITFDLGLIAKFGLTIHAFDPTPRSIEWIRRQSLPEGFHFEPVGIGDYDGELSFFLPSNPMHVSMSIVHQSQSASPVRLPVCRLSTLARNLRHTSIDVLKMDIEGAEYGVLEDILQSEIRISQILVEFHHWYAEVGVAKTRAAIKALNGAGYVIAHVSPSGHEYTFVHKSALGET